MIPLKQKGVQIIFKAKYIKMLPVGAIHLDILGKKTKERELAALEKRPQILMEEEEKGKPTLYV